MDLQRVLFPKLNGKHLFDRAGHSNKKTTWNFSWKILFRKAFFCEKKYFSASQKLFYNSENFLWKMSFDSDIFTWRKRAAILGSFEFISARL